MKNIAGLLIILLMFSCKTKQVVNNKSLEGNYIHVKLKKDNFSKNTLFSSKRYDTTQIVLKNDGIYSYAKYGSVISDVNTRYTNAFSKGKWIVNNNNVFINSEYNYLKLFLNDSLHDNKEMNRKESIDIKIELLDFYAGLEFEKIRNDINSAIIPYICNKEENCININNSDKIISDELKVIDSLGGIVKYEKVFPIQRPLNSVYIKIKFDINILENYFDKINSSSIKTDFFHLDDIDDNETIIIKISDEHLKFLPIMNEKIKILKNNKIKYKGLIFNKILD